MNRELALIVPTPDDDGPAAAHPDTPPLVAELTERMPPGLRPEFRSYVEGADLDTPAVVDAAVAERMIAPCRWLTAAGWLPPDVVREAMTEFGWDECWIGKGNREDWTGPGRRLREQAHRLGLVRGFKGRLVLPAVVRKLVDDPVGLWFFVARSVAGRHRHDAARDATLLLGLEVTAARDGPRMQCCERIAFGLDVLGWRAADGWELSPGVARELVRDGWDVLAQLGVLGELHGRATPLAPEGRAFARAVLRS